MDRVNSVQELIERTAGMPLERMRFFINEDRQEPKCFGIYHDDAEDRWVVYKNKADGSRAVRYSGPEEAYAANELWMKIQSEIGLRRAKKDAKKARREAIINGALFALLAALVIAFMVHELRKPSRGYYVVDDGVYYYQDDYWYYYYDDGWGYYDAPDGEEWYADSYYGDSYPYIEDSFEKSEYYEEPSSGSDDDSDVLDSWDSGDTDWDSDW